MEPMSTTPTSSPVMSSQASVFLPPYLIGEHQSTPKSSDPFPNKANRNSVSFSDNILDFSFKNSNMFSDDIMKQINDQINTPNFDNSSIGPINNRFEIKNKPGPPATSLFDSVNDDSFQCLELPSSSFVQKKNTDYNNVLPNFNESQLQLNSSPTDFWVTIFGFSPDIIQYVLQFFSKMCNIKDKKIPAQGNWVHVKINSRNELEKLLSYNGKIILNQIMIGVQPYRINPSQREYNESHVMSPLNLSTMRSLNQSNINLNASDNHVDLLSNSVSTLPQQTSGIVTKTMEYLFGW